jgi:prepilin-type N-terminal cleavage/methylation domain-containing protein
MKSPRRGFTLIELLVVVSIISMLSSVVLAALSTARNRAIIAKGLTFSNTVRSGLYNDGIVSYSFNEAPNSGISVVNSEFEVNNLNLSSGNLWASPTPDSPTGAGNSLELSGSPERGNFATPINPGPNFTVTVWIKTSAAAGQQSIFSNRACSGCFYLLTHNGRASGYINGTGEFQGNASVSDNKWHHIAWTNDGTTSWIYVDGTLDRSGGHLRSNPANSPESHIGWDATNTSEYFIGYIDDFRIYRAKLAESEIKKIYAEGLAKRSLAAQE